MKRKKTSIKGKTILITGGAMGLGRLLAIECKNRGGIPLIWDINDDGLKEMTNNGFSCSKVDVTNKQKIDEEAEKILSKYGRLDILINNAGVVRGSRLLDLSEKAIRLTFEVNILSHFWTVKAFLPSMIQNKSGHIVSISSTSSYCGTSHLVDYSTTKYACRGFDEALERELIDLDQIDGIKLLHVCPHFMATGMFKGAEPSTDILHRCVAGGFLDPNYVCDQVIKGIINNEREIIMPKTLDFWFKYSHLFLPRWYRTKAYVESNSMKRFQGNTNRLK